MSVRRLQCNPLFVLDLLGECCSRQEWNGPGSFCSTCHNLKHVTAVHMNLPVHHHTQNSDKRCLFICGQNCLESEYWYVSVCFDTLFLPFHHGPDNLEYNIMLTNIKLEFRKKGSMLLLKTARCWVLTVGDNVFSLRP